MRADTADVEEVERFLAAVVPEPLPPEAVALADCAERVLAVDVQDEAGRFAAGRRLQEHDVSALASLGCSHVLVVRRPRVVVVGIDSESGPLLALVARDGGVALPRRGATEQALLAPDADIVLVSVPNAEHGDARRLVAKLGTLDYDGVALEPGFSAGVGRVAGRLVFLLPGDPPGERCAYECLVAPTLRSLGGRPRAPAA